MRILVVFGTRPEAIKCFPVVQELKARKGVTVQVCVTAQHRAILDQVLNVAGIEPDYDLNIMRASQSLTEVTTRVLEEVGLVLDEAGPDRILVQGDTTTTMATALAAFYRHIPVGHIEAGLRSGNIYSPWPEEINRRMVSSIADLHFAPTEEARDNLLKENIAAESIIVTGNTVIDALLAVKQNLESHKTNGVSLDKLIPDIGPDQRLILVTCHRRENWDEGVDAICLALQRLAARADVRIAFPVHPNPRVREPVFKALSSLKHVSLLDPLDYVPFVAAMARAHIILTDSGGVQEEAPALGKPVLVMRDTTERPEGIAAGTARLVGTDSDLIVRETERLLDDQDAYQSMSQAHNPYGDGLAAKRIAECIVNGK